MKRRDFLRASMAAAAAASFPYHLYAQDKARLATDRLKLGLQQLMAGSRKFSLKHLERDDLVALTRESAEVTGIPYIMDSDMKEAERILCNGAC